MQAIGVARNILLSSTPQFMGEYFYSLDLTAKIVNAAIYCQPL